MAFNPDRVKLGRPTELVRNDARTFRLAKYLDYSKLPAAPLRCDYGGNVHAWGMFANDRVGDCAIAGLLHIIMIWASLNGLTVKFTDAVALALYAKFCGYVPGDPSTDNGAILLDILKAWRKEPIEGFEIAAFVSVNPRNWDEIKLAQYLFGPLYWGVDLPRSAQSENMWRDTRDAPGSWGGHCVVSSGYRDGTTCVSPKYLNFVTWGTEQKATPSWVAKYADECYALYSPAWFKDGVAPNGFKKAELDDDLAAFA